MSSKRCFISGCDNDMYHRLKSKSEGIVHYFSPRNMSEAVYQEWCKVVPPRHNKLMGTTTPFDRRYVKHVLCQLHFEDHLIQNEFRVMVNGEMVGVPRERWILEPEAVPTKGLNGGKPENKRAVLRGRRRPPEIQEERRPSVKSEHQIAHFKADYYCAICLGTFSVGLDLLKETKLKEAKYLKFLRVVGNYLGSDFGDFVEKFRKESDPYRISGCLVCDTCEVTVEAVCKLREAMEVARIKFNEEIGTICGVLEGETWAERREELRGKWAVEEVVGVSTEIKKKKSKVATPRVLLNRVRSPNEEDEDASSEDAIRIARKINQEKLKANGDADVTHVCGSSSISRVLGYQAVIKCGTCDKYFASKEEMRDHRKAYHSKRIPMPEVHQPEEVSPATLLNEVIPAIPEVHENCTDDLQDPVTTPQPTSGLNEALLQIKIKEQDQILVGDDMITPCPSPVLSVEDDHDDMEMETDTPDTNTGSDSKYLIPPPSPPPVNTSVPPALPQEPKEEPSTSPPTSKKVPFMSSEYIGKYKILCKLKNLQTGKMVMGVVAKPPTSTSSAPEGIPKVISVVPEKPPKSKRVPLRKKSYLPSIPGPPYHCPLEGCAKTYPNRPSALRHYTFHKKRLAKVQQQIEAGHFRIPRIKKTKQGDPSKSPKKKARKGSGFQFKCDVEHCAGKFRRQVCLDFHRSWKHGSFQCHFCSEPFTNLETLISHEKGDHRDSQDASSSDDLLSCPRCGEPIANKNYGLRNHYASAHYQIVVPKTLQSRPFCQPCNRELFSLEKFRRHLTAFPHPDAESILNRELPLKCDQCEKRFQTKSGLKHHVHRFHGNKDLGSKKGTSSSLEPEFQCDFCGKQYTFKWRYQRHLRMHREHPDWDGRFNFPKAVTPSPLECDICGKFFKRQGRLWLHKRSHEGFQKPRKVAKPRSGTVSKKKATPKTPRTNIRIPFECALCPKVFLTRRAGKIHQASHFAKPAPLGEYVCHQCGKLFGEYRGFRIHLAWHKRKVPGTPKVPKPRLQVPCPLCPKIWPNRGFLKRHLRRVHPEEAPEYEIKPEDGCVCDGCGKVYADKQVLKRHRVKYCLGLNIDK